MPRKQFEFYTAHFGDDFPAGLVVFLVALPLCLGIALASGAPPFSGILAGIVGGLVVAVFSGSQLSVSGPAAGLTVIVAAAVTKLGSFEAFLLSLVIAGAIQLGMGYLRAGVIGAYFPSAVIKGMLAAIGLILIIKQLPHAVGYDADGNDDLSFLEADSQTGLVPLINELKFFTPGAVIVSLVSIAIMLAWERKAVKDNRLLSLVPGPLAAVAFGIAFNLFTNAVLPALSLEPQHLVSLPLIHGPIDFFGHVTAPDFRQWSNPEVYLTAATLAIVASLETLLSLEATDKLDPHKRVAPTNQELKAQGIGNIVSGLVGGLPITAVIVRSSANINAGAQTKVSAVVHGLLLLVSAMFVARLLNLIPLACLAAVLLLTGYKLAKPTVFMETYAKGWSQFIPFIVTVVAVVATDLLKGMALGMIVGVIFVLRANYQSALTLTKDGKNYLLRMQKDVSFFSKEPLRKLLEQIEENSYVIIDGAKAQFVDQDILEMLEDFLKSSADDGIRVEMKNVPGRENRVIDVRNFEASSLLLPAKKALNTI